ncbi:MAG: ABC transporter substrate-binding protein [Acidimicrobiia bacterium]|nr:ABC transporter substrate-binding protein [Acidimicrobiia bacterium]MYC85626.1 ABC transporter substrate-binding protein [Acidimicrobiia bacterium]
MAVGRSYMARWVTVCAVFAALLVPACERANRSEPMKIALMLDYSGAPDVSADRQRGFELAIEHINEGGGVLGHPVEGVTRDATRTPGPAIEAAQGLIEEGVHAIVGPNSSAASLAVVENVTGPAAIPTISPSATSPRLTQAADSDFFFRTTLSDTAQGPVLARVTRDRGFDNVGLIYFDDPYGRGLAGSFAEAWDGGLEAVAVVDGQASYLPELQRSASAGAQALVVVTFGSQALAIVREALDEGVFTQFLFGDAAKRPRLIEEIGGAALGGMHGTAGAPSPDSTAAPAWEDSFRAEFGELPVMTYVRETYDATVALALAAQAAGSLDGAAIRDHLRGIGSSPGQVVLGTAAGVAEGLRLLADGREVDYEGVASSLDWDEHGDLRRGHIEVWRFTPDGRIETVETVLFE